MNIRKNIATVILSVAGIAGAFGAEAINGAGASFPAPLYNKWTFTYNAATGGRFNYQSVGSGAGITQLKARTVDFGASDDPMKPEALSEAGLMQFPTVMGGVVPVVNLKGVESGKLRLTGEILAQIYLGKIKLWSDSRIAEINPGIQLPKIPITPVRRADGSGTTWIFTNYLTKVSKEWSDGPGNGKDVKWPVGIAGKGNPGVANAVRKTVGSIGYIEYAYAYEAKLSCVSLKNRDGEFVVPDMDSFKAAAANADWENSRDFYMILTDQKGGKSWPICGATYILLYKDQKDPGKAAEMVKFFLWALDDGAKNAEELHYVPMPRKITEMIGDCLKKNITSGGKPVIE